ncbi:hypothetical protein ADM96_10365 [Burkholderia sp. ST111]|nr:hypothetical protein ADM96_10365 [Burkholderia sp. ST111]
MGDSAHCIADGALQMAEKCWAFGVTFPRDSDFAAELSLFYGDEAASRERGAPDKTMMDADGFLGPVLAGRLVHPLRKKGGYPER